MATEGRMTETCGYIETIDADELGGMGEWSCQEKATFTVHTWGDSRLSDVSVCTAHVGAMLDERATSVVKPTREAT